MGEGRGGKVKKGGQGGEATGEEGGTGRAGMGKCEGCYRPRGLGQEEGEAGRASSQRGLMGNDGHGEGRTGERVGRGGRTR